jgi:L-ascorbate metabolism protein UlaG (beta-lactamase superfamily)
MRLPADRLTYVGHATTAVRLGGASLLTDPILRSRIGPLRRHAPMPPADLTRDVDAVLVSHLHRDHLDLPSLRLLPAEVRVVVPRGAGATVARAGVGAVQEVSPGERVAVGEAMVTAVPAVHDGRRGPLGRPAETVGYVIEGSGRRVYFAGDTGLHEEMSRLGSPDVALLPVWGWGPSLGPGHLDPAAAARALTLIHPRVAVPIHWGSLYPLGLRRLRPGRLTEPPAEFAARAAELAPEVEVRVLAPGEMMEL